MFYILVGLGRREIWIRDEFLGIKEELDVIWFVSVDLKRGERCVYDYINFYVGCIN